MGVQEIVDKVAQEDAKPGVLEIVGAAVQAVAVDLSRSLIVLKNDRVRKKDWHADGKRRNLYKANTFFSLVVCDA